MKSDKTIAQDLAIEKCYKKNEDKIYNKSLLLVADTSSIDTGFKVIVKDMHDSIFYTEDVTNDEIDRKKRGVVLLTDDSGITFEVTEKILKKFKKLLNMLDNITGDIYKFNKKSKQEVTIMVLDDSVILTTDNIQRHYNDKIYGANYCNTKDENGESISETFRCLGAGGRWVK